VEVINFGVSGYGTAQELITLREHVWDYSPDIVLLAFNGSNDVTDNSRALRKEEGIPYFIYRDGALALDSSFRDSQNYQLRDSSLNRLFRTVRDYSRVLQFVYDLPNVIAANNAAKRIAKDKEGGGAALIDTSIYRPPADQVWTEAWTITEALMILMRDEVVKRGAKFLVVTLDTSIEVHPDPRIRQAFINRLGLSDLSYPDQRIMALGASQGFEVLYLAPMLQAHAEQHKVFLHGFGQTLGQGHWNEEGHRVGGELMARKLCEQAR
jgi:hypothetical protein